MSQHGTVSTTAYTGKLEGNKIRGTVDYFSGDGHGFGEWEMDGFFYIRRPPHIKYNFVWLLRSILAKVSVVHISPAGDYSDAFSL